MNPIEPTTPISVSLQAQEWNAVITLLGETGPWRVVNPLIGKITEQAQAAADQLPAQQLTNGAAAHVPD
jgi:hypothetical protein